MMTKQQIADFKTLEPVLDKASRGYLNGLTHSEKQAAERLIKDVLKSTKSINCPYCRLKLLQELSKIWNKNKVDYEKNKR